MEAALRNQLVLQIAEPLLIFTIEESEAIQICE